METYFDNKEGYKENIDLEFHSHLEPINIKTSSLEERQQHIKNGLLNQINSIINQGHKLILVYPVPEMGISPDRYLLSRYVFNKKSFKNSIPIFSGSYEVYKDRNKIIFEIFDNIESPNIYKVYPHKLFCDNQIKGRCVGNDENNIYYFDDDHLSIYGSKFVVDQIMRKIEEIELKSKLILY